MKKLLLGLLFIFSYSVHASSSIESCCQVSGAVFSGILGAMLYQGVVGIKQEDTLFIGTESGSRTLKHLSFKEDSFCKCSSNYCTTYKAGIGLGRFFIGYQSNREIDYQANRENVVKGLVIKGLVTDDTKTISRNDWNALAVGVVTGAVTYMLITSFDKK